MARTVKELIERLEALDPDLPIRIGMEESEDAYDIKQITRETDPETDEMYYCIEG